jgi:hypothetical protein
VSAAEVRDAGSSATEVIRSRETFDTSSTDRTSDDEAIPRDGTIRRPGILWYSIEGIRPTSASPRASFSAQTEGMSRETSTPAGGSRRRPHVRGRAFKKSTTEKRIMLGKRET